MGLTKSEQAPLLRAIPTFARLGIGRTKAYSLMNSGIVPAVKLSRATYIRRADWENFVANLPAYRTNAAEAAMTKGVR